MAKKKNKHHPGRHRNAAPRAPRAATKPGEETPLQRLGYTAAGAAGSAMAGAFLARQGWAPKTIAGVLAAVGAGLAWKGEGNTIRSLGAGTMSSAGGQLALMVIDDREQPKVQVATAKRPSNADELPPDALQSAFERAREQIALASGDPSAVD